MPRTLLIVLAVALIISGGLVCPLAPQPGSSPGPQADAWLDSVSASPDPAHEVAELINQFRTEQGLQPLALDSRLAEAAQRHSDDMATHNFFDHTGSDGSDPWRRMRDAGYPLNWGAECIAAGQPDARSVMEAWLGSPDHRKVLLGDFVHIGAGFAQNSGSTYGFYWTVDLAVPLPVTASPTPMTTWSPTPVATSTATSTPRPATPTGTSTPRPATPTGTAEIQLSVTYTPTSTPRPPTPTPEVSLPSPTATPISYPGPGTPGATFPIATYTATPIGYQSPTPRPTRPWTGNELRIYLPLLCTH